MTEKRTFAMVDGSHYRGNYKSTTPSGAARKAASRLFKESPRAKTIKVAIAEITRGSKVFNEFTHAKEHKVFDYKATKVLLAKPRVVTMKDGTKYVQKHEIKVKAVDRC